VAVISRVGPGGRIAVQAAVGTLVGLAVVVALVAGVSVADRGLREAMRPGEIVRLLGPLCCAMAVALSVASSRLAGRWDAWEGLGVRPARQLAPLLLIAALGAGGQALAPPAGPPSASLAPVLAPAPVPSDARRWPACETGRWAEPDLTAWQIPPSALTGRALRARARLQPPLGARGRVDHGELVRRRGLVLAWPLAALLGVAVGLRRTRDRRRRAGSPLPGIAGAAGGLAALWLLAVLVASAYVGT